MSTKIITRAEKKSMRAALGITLVTAGLAVLLNSLMTGSWRTDFSVSRYVGLETWSALLFGAGNFVVAGLALKYLYLVGEKWQMPRLFYWLVVILVIGLIGLSMCPLGYFDQGAVKSVPSRVHELCSRTMFVTMAGIALLIALCKVANRRTRVVATCFVIYGIGAALAFMLKFEWFVQQILWFESAYLVGFLAFCESLQGKEK